MTTMSEDPRERDAVEALLQHAKPRPAPPADVEKQVRSAVEAEWQQVAGRRRWRRRVVATGLAASVALAAVVAFNMLNIGVPSSAIVASVDKVHGPVFRLGPDAELIEMQAEDSVIAGQILVSQNQGGVGLRWNNDSSLRVDGNTRLEIVSADEVFLHSGRIYFDSRTPGAVMSTDSAKLKIATPHGAVRHLGTQFMAQVDGATLRVSVREGQVAVTGGLHDGSASRGQQLEITGGGRPVMTNISPSSTAWQWTEATAPSLVVDGMSTWDFLHWVGRETGLEVRFANAAAEQIARQGTLRGRVNADPRTELRLRMLGEDLGYTIAGGVITVAINE